MNWLQKIAYSPPETYLDLGHDFGRVILWKYDGGSIMDAEKSEELTDHGDMPNAIDPHDPEDMGNPESYEASGRIEVDKGIGSIGFNIKDTKNTRDIYLRQQILEALIQKYPGIKFFVYGYGGSPVNLQTYWEGLEVGIV